MTYTDAGASAPVIELDGVWKGYGGTPVLQGVDLHLERGVYALLGPNGAGKTTLVNILTTLVRPDAGNARVLGTDTVTRSSYLRRRMRVTGQSCAVDEGLTGAENLVMMGRLLGIPARRAQTLSRELLDRFELADAADRPVRTYSGGMRRRLDLAVSFIWTPEILFLDEPTTGLDTRSRYALWAQIRELAAGGTTVFLTTQYLEEADQLAEEIILLDRGRIVAQGSPDQLKALGGDTVLQVIDPAGTVLREVPTDGTAADLARLAADVATTDPDLRIDLRRPSLDSVFLQVTGAAPDRCDIAGSIDLPATKETAT